MTITPFFFGVLACLAAETIVILLFTLVGNLIEKIATAKMAVKTIDEILAQKGEENERSGE